MQDFAYWGALAALAALMVWVIVSDLKSRRIPNWLNLSVALLALPYWWGQGGWTLATLGEQLALAGAVAVIFGIFWWRGVLGGGDWKLHIALALWLPLIPLLEMLIVMSLFGAVVTLAFWAEHRWRKRPGQVRTPYGLAIAAAAFVSLGEPIVNSFPA